MNVGARSPSLVALLTLALLAGGPVAARAHDEVHGSLRALDAATVRTPGDAALWLRRAELARIAGDRAGAEAALDRAAALVPAAAAIALGRAALALDGGRHDEASRQAQVALAAAPTRAEAAAAHLLAARAAAAQDRADQALDAYDDAFALAAHPSADVALERAALALRLGRADDAAAGIAAARTRLPHDRALAETAAALGVPLAPPPAPSIDRFTPAPARPAASLVLLPRNSTWRWSTTGSEPAGWAAAAYDDSAWPAGPGALGFGDPFIATMIPSGPNGTVRYTTSYFRTSFDVDDPPASFAGLSLIANHDDGFLARLNGQEIARRNLPAGAIAYGTFATLHEGGSYAPIDVGAFTSLLVQGTNVLAVEVHQAASNSSDLAWDGELVATTGGAGVVRGPYLQSAAPDAMTVRWRTDLPTDSRVWIGPAPGALGVAATEGASTTEHELRITGLTPESTVYYAVGSTSAVLAGDDSAHVFTLPPLAGEARPTRVWVLGDSGIPGAPQNRVRDAYSAFTGTTPTDVWLMLGDNAYFTGTDSEYDAGVFTPYRSFLRGHCLWATRGNHDAIHSGGANDYYDLFTFPTAAEAGGAPSSSEAWYSFDHGDIHFVCLDSEGSDRSPGGAMLTWLTGDLAANNRTWVVAFWHHPPYTKGSHDSDLVGDSGGRMRDMRENALPILESYGVDLVLCGHSHSYERSYLIDGHDGTSGTLTPAMILDDGDGSPDGDGAYEKPTAGPAPHEGEVVAVAGSSAQVSGGTLDHPAMFRSLNVLGSLVLDIDINVLRGTFLDDLGAVRDSFTIRKGAIIGAAAGRGAGLALRVDGANPSRGGAVRLAFDLPAPGEPVVRIVDVAGRHVRGLALGQRSAGAHTTAWDGNDESGRRAPAGLYFATMDHVGARRTARIVIVP